MHTFKQTHVSTHVMLTSARNVCTVSSCRTQELERLDVDELHSNVYVNMCLSYPDHALQTNTAIRVLPACLPAYLAGCQLGCLLGCLLGLLGCLLGCLLGWLAGWLAG